MSTKSKNPGFKRVKVSVTQKIIDMANPNRPMDCYFYHAMKDLINYDRFVVWFDEYSIDRNRVPLSKKANKYVERGCAGKTVVPTDFNIYIPIKHLKKK